MLLLLELSSLALYYDLEAICPGASQQLMLPPPQVSAACLHPHAISAATSSQARLIVPFPPVWLSHGNFHVDAEPRENAIRKQ